MKKSFVILFAMFYLALASGLNVSLHYCGGKLKNISLFHNTDEKGCCGNKKRSKKCCHEKSSFIKVKEDQFASPAIKFTNNPVKSLPPIIFNEQFVIHKSTIASASLNNHSPPVFYDNPLYLKQRVLII